MTVQVAVGIGLLQGRAEFVECFFCLPGGFFRCSVFLKAIQSLPGSDLYTDSR
jgi:hypothetical protein